mmetsp:Transcript_8525/g.29907  ORF Transcript_8525/g.29907 Transcript_8525/m.29907 type:complete len:203 (-) Transcript_8525:1156-1764(-)
MTARRGPATRAFKDVAKERNKSQPSTDKSCASSTSRTTSVAAWQTKALKVVARTSFSGARTGGVSHMESASSTSSAPWRTKPRARVKDCSRSRVEFITMAPPKPEDADADIASLPPPLASGAGSAFSVPARKPAPASLLSSVSDVTSVRHKSSAFESALASTTVCVAECEKPSCRSSAVLPRPASPSTKMKKQRSVASAIFS